MPKALDNFTWPSTPTGPVLVEDSEEDCTEYDMQPPQRLWVQPPLPQSQPPQRLWVQPPLPFETVKLSDGTEVPK